MKHKVNYLGFNRSLNEYIYSKLDLITEALEDELRNSPEFKHVKNCSFTLDEDSEILSINLLLRSNEKISKEFKLDQIKLSSDKEFLLSFYGEEKLEELTELFNEFGGSLTESFLENKEPELLKQLKILNLVESAPNQYEGKPLTDKQLIFVKEISQNQY